MTEDELGETTKRSVSTQDLSWLIEHSRLQRLDLDPPYQRRSVWTPRDRRSFMDTVFKNYPSPPIYLHKTIDLDTGNAMYHVVDGKQRISTVLQFLVNKVYLPHEFGDARFDGKRWRDLANDDAGRAALWNLAEDAGFEPARAVNPTRFPSERHRPLGESSAEEGTGSPPGPRNLPTAAVLPSLCPRCSAGREREAPRQGPEHRGSQSRRLAGLTSPHLDSGPTPRVAASCRTPPGPEGSKGRRALPGARGAFACPERPVV